MNKKKKNWRLEPATEKQKEFLIGLVNFPKSLTKLEAKILIDENKDNI